MDEEIQPLVTAREVDVKGLVNSMKEKLVSISKRPSPPLFHICRVPAHIRKDDHVYYNPKIVSIGPFHRLKRNLRAMEEHKWRYLHKVIHHVPEPYQFLERCVEEMKNKEEEVRKCYSGSTLNLGKDEFVKMMLLDGCFVIQILFFLDSDEENEPIVNNEWMMPLIIHDMLLLENQLPFCVLKCLANLIGKNTKELKTNAIKLLVPNCMQSTKKESPEHDQLPEQSTESESSEHETNIHHLLHLVLMSLKPDPPSNAEPSCAQLLQAVVRKILTCVSPRYLANNKHEGTPLLEDQEAGAPSSTVQPQEAEASSSTVQPQHAEASSRPLNSIPTATELEEAGVVFKRNEEGSLWDVTFQKGVMRLPHLQMDDVIIPLFRNMIAFEQCFPGNGGDFTSYCIFMDSLVNTPSDVQILKKSHIIENLVGSDEEVALLFNQLCKGIAAVNLGKGSVRRAVYQYAEAPWHKWRATLKHNYFSNPWAVISLIAAVYALTLASVSTYYSVF